jgi:thiol-disulfide isomerase/thioredoxin
MGDIDPKSVRIASAFLFVLLIVSLGVYYAYRSSSGFKARENADIRQLETAEQSDTFVDLYGVKTTLVPEDREVLVVNTWASWSPFTPGEIQTLAELQGVFSETVRFVALNRMEDPTTARAYLSTIPEYPHIEFVIDTHDTFYKTVGGYAMPETIIYDRIGNIVYHTRGQLRREEVEPILRGLITED